MKPRALIVDDERAECEMFADALRDAGFDPQWDTSPLAALTRLETEPFDVVITDLNMPVLSGSELCSRIKQLKPNLPVVVVTAFGSIDSAVIAMRAGAYDFVTKPFDVDTIGLVLKRAVENHELRAEVDALRRVVDTSQRYGALIGSSEPMRRLYGTLDHLQTGDSTVLVTGESGTGKELVAREIHTRGSRKDRPFVAVSCAAMPETLLESELFGHEKGAFTDARTRRDGLLVSAQGGTLLLDEIGDMPLALQGKLLRALEERTVRALGSNHEVPFDVRVIAATNRDLEAAVEQGRFREDLFYRVNVIHLELPPLRSRSGDVLLLAQAFLGELAVRSGRPIAKFSAAAAEKLVAYDWPGNVRELRNCVERAVTLSHAELVDVQDLPRKVRDFQPGHVLIAGDDPSELLPLEEVERRYIARVIAACAGNKSKAARILGIGRKTLYRHLDGSVPPGIDDE
ncbi:MAG TPA: sigma-54 dependent transcriptional regulator [Polyangiaceae bacterium]|nr:sigma-54 dependent transcriptional regulator [Polyangiaceae bacterium]